MMADEANKVHEKIIFTSRDNLLALGSTRDCAAK